MPLSKIQLSEATGRRNLIINGAMQIFQRATAATTSSNGAYTTVDRFAADKTNDGAFTTEKSTDNPFGTGSSLKAQVTTADTSLASSQYARIVQKIEAQNLQHLLYGTSSAKTLTLSFWVKSSKTGIYSITLRKTDNTAYHFCHEYTISSANTWEKKVITITPTAGSTSFITASAGAIADDNGLGFELSFALGQGSSYAIGTSNTWSNNTSTFASTNQVNWMDNTSNNFYLTQVQLEVGNLTDFEHRSVTEELSLCQRYYCKSMRGDPANNIPTSDNTSADGYHAWTFFSATSARTPFFFHPQVMRAIPTVTLFSTARANTANKTAIYNDGASSWGAVASNGTAADTQRLAIYCSTSSNFTSSRSYLFGGGYQCDAEL